MKKAINRNKNQSVCRNLAITAKMACINRIKTKMSRKKIKFKCNSKILNKSQKIMRLKLRNRIRDR